MFPPQSNQGVTLYKRYICRYENDHIVYILTMMVNNCIRHILFLFAKDTKHWLEHIVMLHVLFRWSLLYIWADPRNMWSVSVLMIIMLVYDPLRGSHHHNCNRRLYGCELQFLCTRLIMEIVPLETIEISPYLRILFSFCRAVRAIRPAWL